MLDEALEVAHPGAYPLEVEPKPAGGCLGLGGQRGIVDLRQIDEAGVVLEVGVTKLRVAVEAEAFDDQLLELPGQKVGEIEGARRGLRQGRETIAAGKGCIAVGAGEALDLLLLEHRVEDATCATIRIGDDDAGMGGASLMDGAAHGIRDQRGPVVQGGRQTAKVEVGETVGLDEGDDLPGEGATGNDQCALHRLQSRKMRTVCDSTAAFGTPAQPIAGTRIWMCFFFIKAWAVSTATDASRQ